MMNDYSSLIGIVPFANAAKVLGLTRHDLMKMGAAGKLVIREVNGKFFVEIDSIKKN